MLLKKIEVLFLLHLPPPIHGASIACSYIKNSKTLNEEIEATYINLALNSKLTQSGKFSMSKVKPAIALIWNVKLILSKKRFNLCHFSISADGLGFYKDFLLTVLLKLYGVKIIYHFHNKGVAEGSKKWLNRNLYRYIFRGTKSILLSPFLYEDIKDFVKESDVYYCPYGIPIIDKKNLIPNSEFSNECKLLFLGNMMSEKGIYVLLDALQILKRSQTNFVCHFVGGWSDISETDFNRNVHQRGMCDVVFAHGPKYGNEKYQFLKDSDIFVFPTFYHFEAFPLVTLEAMQFGLPIISTSEGGLRDIVLNNTTGIIVPKKNSTELAKQIELLINQKELRERLGEEGRKRFFQNYTLDKFEKNLLNVLKEAARD